MDGLTPLKYLPQGWPSEGIFVRILRGSEMDKFGRILHTDDNHAEEYSWTVRAACWAMLALVNSEGERIFADPPQNPKDRPEGNELDRFIESLNYWDISELGNEILDVNYSTPSQKKSGSANTPTNDGGTSSPEASVTPST